VQGALAALFWWICPDRDLRHPPGVRIDAEPIQTMVEPQPLGQRHGYDLTAVAAYDLRARVLHTKRYWTDRDDLVPYDVALGWGPMSDQGVLDRLEISQGNRFFFYAWSNQPPLPVSEIVCHAANNHLIAANDAVAAAVKRLRRGQFVHLRGYLVNVTGPKGFRWNTSLDRTDSGNGACELFYVESIEVTDDPV
jgi:hypothetical protein